MNIITLCTKNYKDCLEWVLPSWKNQCNNIHVYTDFDFNFGDDIYVKKLFGQCTDWIEIVGWKPIMIQHYLLNYDCDDIVFLDVDCYLKSDISEIFKLDFDVAATRMFDKNKGANSGVIFLRNNLMVKWFIEEWVKRQLILRNGKVGIRAHKEAYEQIAYSQILHDEFNGNNLKILNLDSNVYNCEDDNNENWIRKVHKYKPKILHFKNSRWKDKFLVSSVLG